MPVVWFDVGLSQGRIHIAQRAGETAWWFEGRIYYQSLALLPDYILLLKYLFNLIAEYENM